MGLFKSKREKEFERALEIKRGIQQIRKHISDLKINEREFIKKARRAQELRDEKQLGFLKKTIQKTAGQRLMMERQLLTIQTASQIQDQVKCHSQFAKAMSAVSKSIAEIFQSTDLVKVQKNFETAMQNAETLDERLSLFLDISSNAMVGYEDSESGELVSESDVDRMIESSETDVPERDELDNKIDKELKELNEELRKTQRGE